MELILIIAPLLGPIAAVVIARRLGWRSIWLQLLAAGVAGAGFGAFLANAASAMSTASNPQAAMVRGAWVGFLIGLAVGCLTIGIISLINRRSQKAV